MGKKRKLTEALRKDQEAAAKRAKVKAVEETPPLKAKPPPPKRWIPFDDSDHILLVGEGNLSFALSLRKLHTPHCSMWATCYDSLEVAREKYDDLEANKKELEDLGVKVIFGVDAGALEKCKPLREKRFSKIAFLFPHVGLGEKDQDRNVALNQILLLRFFKSAAPFLREASKPAEAIIDPPSDFEDAPDDAKPSSDEAGSIIVALKDGKPYSLWNLACVLDWRWLNGGRNSAHRSLAKKGPVFAAALTPSAKDQPIYKQVRSAAFDPSDYPGYGHRRTIGFVKGKSYEGNEDLSLSAKERGKGQQGKSNTRVWQFRLSR